MLACQPFATRQIAGHGFGVAARLVSAALIAAAVLGGIQASWIIEAEREWRAAAELERVGGAIVWAWRLDERVQEKRFPCYRPPSWLVPGDAFVEGVNLLNCQDPDLSKKLTGLTTLRGLRYLALGNASITDAALAPLAGLRQLEWLDLRDTPISDVGLAHLPASGRLETLNLANTRVTDESLPRLAKLTRLKWLNLCGTRVSSGGIAMLRSDLPGTKIQSDFEPVAILDLSGSVPNWARGHDLSSHSVRQSRMLGDQPLLVRGI